MDGMLAGLRVLELSGWAGAFAGRLLADAGATVVRVTPGEDFLDREPPFFGTSGVSVQAAWYNAGKQLVAAEFADDEALARQLAALAAESDIVLATLPPGEAPEVVRQSVRGAPVVVSISPFGEDGPWAAYRANDLVANALSGAASVTGNEATPPLSGYGNQTYHTVGFYAAICGLAALRAHRLTGERQFVDLSSHEALIGCTEQVLMQWFFPGFTWGTPIAARQGSLHWSRAYEVMPGKRNEGIMVTAALRFAESLLPWLIEEGAAQELTNPEKYPNLVAMIRDLPYVMQVLRDWTRTKDEEEMFFEAQRRHQPFGHVKDIAQAAHTPQLEARQYFREQEVPGFGRVPFPGRFMTTPADGPHPSPGRRTEASAIRWPERPPVAREHAGAPEPGLPLKGVRIMDFTHVLAGPFGTRVLGDLGAEVIKIGTAARGGGANSTDHPYYCMWNRNKLSLSLNMGTEEGRELARELASRCDIIIENFSAGVLARWGLDRAAMAARNPGLSVITMGGMGQTGPWKNFVTFAPTIHALCGLTYLTNPPGQRMLGYGFSLTDHLSGLAGAFAVLAALEHRRTTGAGLDIDISQYELGMGIMAPAFLDCFANGTEPSPRGNRHPFDAWAPHGIYPCSGEDRWVAIAVQGEEQWQALCAVMGQPALSTDARFATHAARIANQDELDALVARWTEGHDRYDVMRRCQEAGISAGAVQDARDLTQADPQTAARDFFTTMTTMPHGEHGTERFPARFNGVRPPRYEGAHVGGADTFEVVSGIMGLDDERFAALAASGALT